MPTIGWFEILIVVGIAIIVLGPKDFPIMLKKAGSWIGTAKKYMRDIQSEVSNIEIDDEKINEIKKDDKILIEGSVLIPLFKAFFTKNSLDFYEKISKTYYKGDYKYLSSFLNNDITFNSFQNIFLSF